MATSVFSQAFGYKFFFQVIKKGSVNLATLQPNAGLGAGKFIDNTTTLSNSALVFPIGATGSETPFQLIAGGTKTVTRAEVATNVAKLTFAEAHGFTVGATVVVSGLPAPFAALNGTRVITAVTTSSPFTLSFAFTASNIADAAVASGTASGAVLTLDGSDAPVRMLGLTNCAPSESESEETITTYDDEAASFDTSIATGKSMSWSLEGVTNHTDAAYKLMRIAAKESVREGLMVKYARIGPVGINETTYGYGRFTGFDETPPAGGIVSWSSTLRAYGPYELEF
jgi:hypothetical protein